MIGPLMVISWDDQYHHRRPEEIFPCPGTFEQKYNISHGFYYGHLTIISDNSGKYILEVNMSIAKLIEKDVSTLKSASLCRLIVQSSLSFCVPNEKIVIPEYQIEVGEPTS